MRKVDLLIVGQGIAGINLSFLAMNQGLSCHHIHCSTEGESTAVAAGLINPITGRRFVKSWNIENILPYAVQHYEDLGAFLNGQYLKRLNIIRTFKANADENEWLAKSADPFLAQFLLEKIVFDRGAFAQKLELSELMGELKDCLRIELARVQVDYHKYLIRNNLLTNEHYDLAEQTFDGNQIIYKDIQAKQIVFAEGWRAMYNPLWESVPFAPAKGELLIIHSPELKLNTAFKNSMFITPIGSDRYWVGATYEWQNYDPNTSDKMKTKLLKSLDATIKVPYKIEAHLTGIRPSSKDRKPIIGAHEKHKNVFLFNGMGTKGSSLSPYYARMLLANMQQNTEIDHEVSISRYFSS